MNDRKSTSGYLFMMIGGTVTWKSKKQNCVALSTAEAESAAQECAWLGNLSLILESLLKDLQLFSKTTSNHCNDQKPTIPQKS